LISSKYERTAYLTGKFDPIDDYEIKLQFVAGTRKRESMII